MRVYHARYPQRSWKPRRTPIFERHPNAEILFNLPGFVLIFAAQVIGEFGDDRTRSFLHWTPIFEHHRYPEILGSLPGLGLILFDAASRRTYSRSAPIPRTSGKAAWRRYTDPPNRRLADTCRWSRKPCCCVAALPVMATRARYVGWPTNCPPAAPLPHPPRPRQRTGRLDRPATPVTNAAPMRSPGGIACPVLQAGQHDDQLRGKRVNADVSATGLTRARCITRATPSGRRRAGSGGGVRATRRRS